MRISIDYSSHAGLLSPFWNSTGFTPATLLLTSDMRQQVMFWGSIPRAGLRFARVHYLLELVEVAFVGKTASRYDWTRLDHALDLLIQNGMSPIFEIMGNPGGQFSDFNDDLQLHRWRCLVQDLALHVMERYGRDEVERWYFETWNEPDIGFGWSHQWPQDETSFCNYYDACVDGLSAANPNLIIGGPGTCRTLSHFFQTFIVHCESGINYFTQQPGTRLDFISVHEKAVQAHKEDLTPRTQTIIEREMQIMTYIRQSHPHLATLQFMNNECDPQVGWKDYHTWHATSYYAAWVCKSVIRHIEHLMDQMGIAYALLSNDNGFIGEWGHRTLLARFGKSGWIEDGQSSHSSQHGWAVCDFPTPEYSMVKKPVFGAMALLSLLMDGNQPARRLNWIASGKMADPAAKLDILATAGTDNGIAILITHTRDQINTSGRQKISLRLDKLPFPQAVLAHYRIDEYHCNPFAVWETFGALDTPDNELLSTIRKAQEPAMLHQPEVISIIRGKTQIDFELPLHAVSLVMLLPQPEDPPEQVTGLICETFNGVSGEPELLLRWNPLPSRAIKTYDVLWSAAPEGPFEQVLGPDLICSAMILDDKPAYYKVLARDFWDRVGLESACLPYLMP